MVLETASETQNAFGADSKHGICSEEKSSETNQSQHASHVCPQKFRKIPISCGNIAFFSENSMKKVPIRTAIRAHFEENHFFGSNFYIFYHFGDKSSTRTPVDCASLFDVDLSLHEVDSSCLYFFVIFVNTNQPKKRLSD